MKDNTVPRSKYAGERVATKRNAELDFLSFPVLARTGLDSNRKCVQAVTKRQAEYTDREAVFTRTL